MPCAAWHRNFESRLKRSILNGRMPWDCHTAVHAIMMHKDGCCSMKRIAGFVYAYRKRGFNLHCSSLHKWAYYGWSCKWVGKTRVIILKKSNKSHSPGNSKNSFFLLSLGKWLWWRNTRFNGCISALIKLSLSNWLASTCANPLPFFCIVPTCGPVACYHTLEAT